jgi:DNA-binding MarR family transcriptional regulator
MTTSQLDLMFSRVRFPRAHATDPRSSHEAAAEGERTGAFKKQAQRVLDGLRGYTNCTSAELSRHIDMDLYAIRRRLTELEAAGLVDRIDPTDDTVPCEVSRKKVCRWRLA